MAASSPDQHSDAPASQQPVRAGKHRFWIGLLINIIIFSLVAIIVLVVLIHFNIIPSQWYGPLFGILGPAFGGVFGFVRTTVADKDFQGALRKRLTQWVAGDGEKESKDEKTAPTPPVTATQQQHFVTAIETTAFAHIESIFLVGAPLPNPGEFYGRLDERMTLFGRTRKGYSTSIVGARRTGKTWLISFLQFAIADESGTQFRAGYIDATRPICATPAGFTACALEAWGMPVPGTMHAHLNLATLEETIKGLRARQEIPVLCIDEFEHFGDHTVFDLHFFSELRSLAGPGLGLCLVIASKTPLIDIVGDIGKTSGFFNIFEQLTLKPFNSEDADEFINAKGAQAGFDEQEREYLRTNGREYSPKGPQWPPLRLQIAGALLERDKKLAAAGHPGHYRPADVDYWKEFEERLEEKYRGMVKA